MRKSTFSVTELLRILGKHNAKYIPVTDYNRIGSKTSSDNNLFKFLNNETRGNLNNLVFNKTRKNVSVSFIIEGTVDLDKKRAAAVRLPETIRCKRMKNHTIIKDGQLNIKEFNCEMNYDCFNEISKRLDECDIEEKVIESLGDNIVHINLEKLEMVDKDTINFLDRIMLKTQYVHVMDVQTKVIKHFIKETDAALNERIENSLTIEQIELLKENGLSKDLFFVGVKDDTQKASTDFLEVEEVEFYLKGFKSIPSVDKLISTVKSGKKLTPPLQELNGEIEALKSVIAREGLDLNKPDLELLDFLKSYKEICENTRKDTMLELLNLRMLVVEELFEGLPQDKKGNYLFECPSFNKTLVITMKKKLIEI
jgi:hypothetical protein